MQEVSAMVKAYAQWVEITIYCEGGQLSVKNAHLKWGKFYQFEHKDHEIDEKEINHYVIDSGEFVRICSCGRSDASSGTEGSFDLYRGETKIGHYYWDCPWGDKHNKSEFTPVESGEFKFDFEKGNLYAGAIGQVQISIYLF